MICKYYLTSLSRIDEHITAVDDDEEFDENTRKSKTIAIVFLSVCVCVCVWRIHSDMGCHVAGSDGAVDVGAL